MSETAAEMGHGAWSTSGFPHWDKPCLGHCSNSGKCIHLQAAHELLSGAHPVLGEPPEHMAPQGISAAEQKPRQAKDQLGLSKGEWDPSRQQGLEKTELCWADTQLLSLGSCVWHSSAFPHTNASFWQGQHPRAVLHSSTGDRVSPKMPLGVSVTCAILHLVPQTFRWWWW